MEFLDNLISGIYVMVGIACAVTLMAIYLWAEGVMGTIETRGAAIAIAEKTVSAPCLSMVDSKGYPEKFIFNKSALDKYNNSVICAGSPDALNLPGTFYHIEIRSSNNVWHFNNTVTDYAYNTHARGITKTCISKRLFTTLAGFKAQYPSPYDLFNGNALHFSGIMGNDDTADIATLTAIVDADSGTDYYLDGYPLCLCDLPCPYNKCLCAAECGKPLENVGRGKVCT